MVSTKDPVKKERYDQKRTLNISNARNRIRKIKQSGQNDERRLGFILEIAQMMGYNLKEFGKMSGNSAQSVSWIFNVRDNCSLSKARELLAGIGYTLDLRLETQPNRNRTRSGPQGVNVQLITDIGPKQPGPMPEWFLALKDENNPLNFIYKLYMKTPCASITEFCRNTMINHDDGGSSSFDPSSLRHFIKKRDMPISHIYDMAKSWNATLTWIVKLKETT